MNSTLKISIVQTDLLWEDKQGNLQAIKEKLKPLIGSDLVVLPEMFSTGFTNNVEVMAEAMEGPTINKIKDWAEEMQSVITGSLIIQDAGNYYNRMVWVRPDRSISFYDKKHLFTLAKEHEHFTAGQKKKIIELKGWRFSLNVCYDLRFPVWSRRIDNEDENYDVLLYVASWPTTRITAWSALLKARAIENMAYVVGVNRVGKDGNDLDYSGYSAVYGAFGEDVASFNPNEEGIRNVTLEMEELKRRRQKLNFQNDADAFKLL